jgi:hypothetical protein
MSKLRGNAKTLQQTFLVQTRHPPGDWNDSRHEIETYIHFLYQWLRKRNKDVWTAQGEAKQPVIETEISKIGSCIH